MKQMWPQFLTLQPLDGTRGFTAEFYDHDEASDRVRYLVRVFDSEKQTLTAELVAEVRQGTREELRDALGRLAIGGVSNADCTISDERWIPATLETYRAAHPFVLDAVMNVERPDWAMRLAFEAADDKRHALASGATLAISFRGPIQSAIAAITPWPSTLSAIRRWSAFGESWETGFDTIRAWTFGGLSSPLLLLLVNEVLSRRSIADTGTRTLILSIAIPLLAYPLRRLARATYEIGLRRKFTSIDENAALEQVVEALAEGADPSRIPTVVMAFRRYVATIAKLPTAPLIERVDLGGRLSNKRRSRSIFLWHDAERGVRYFRVGIYRGKRQLDRFVAEIKTDDLDVQAHSAAQTVRARLEEVAEAGRTNTTFTRRRPPTEAFSAPTQRRRELQRLLVRMNRGDIGGGYEAWEAQGAQHSTPEQQAAIRAEAEATLRQHDRDREALLALIASTDQAELQTWAGVHEKYFSEYLSELAAKGEANSIAAEFARRGLDEWTQVRAGKQPYSKAHVAIDEARYRTYFGIDSQTLEDV